MDWPSISSFWCSASAAEAQLSHKQAPHGPAVPGAQHHPQGFPWAMEQPLDLVAGGDTLSCSSSTVFPDQWPQQYTATRSTTHIPTQENQQEHRPRENGKSQTNKWDTWPNFCLGCGWKLYGQSCTEQISVSQQQLLDCRIQRRCWDALPGEIMELSCSLRVPLILAQPSLKFQSPAAYWNSASWFSTCPGVPWQDLAASQWVSNSFSCWCF